MKRVAVHRLEGVDALVLEDVPAPEPAVGEVRLRVGAVGLGFVDELLIAGRYQWKPPLPYVPGGEIAGTIDAVGDGVAGWSAGQRVVAWRMGGGLAEYCTVPAGALVPVPDGLPLETAAAVVLDYATADYALNVRGRLQPDEAVFVLGANGGVGGAAMQIARANGATPVAGVSAGHRRDAAMARGAMATVDLSAPDWRDELRAVLKGKAPDVVVDPLGGPLTEPAFRSLAKRGRHLVIGFAAGGIPALPVNLALLKNADLLGVDIRDFAESEPDRFAERVKTLLERIARGELAPPPVCKHDFSASKDAFRSLQSRDRSGKPVIAMESG